MEQKRCFLYCRGDIVWVGDMVLIVSVSERIMGILGFMFAHEDITMFIEFQTSRGLAQ